ncbi:MAG: hypothetical protein VW907_06340 [Opitutae bacterium]
MADTTQTTEYGSSSESTTTTTPYQQPYYNQALKEAQRLFQKGLPDFYKGPMVAGFTPAQLESFNLSSNWITGGAQDMMKDVGNYYRQMMSGQVNTGEGSPYAGMMDAYKSQVLDASKDIMGQLRSSQVMSGQYGGSSRGDMLNNQVIQDANKQMADYGAQMYMNAYNQAQQQQANALSQYGSIMNMPLQMSTALYNKVGLPQQQLNQALIDAQRQQYDYYAMRPYQNLSQFMNFISPNMGGTVTANQSSGGSSTTTLLG